MMRRWIDRGASDAYFVPEDYYLSIAAATHDDFPDPLTVYSFEHERIGKSQRLLTGEPFRAIRLILIKENMTPYFIGEHTINNDRYCLMYEPNMFVELLHRPQPYIKAPSLKLNRYYGSPAMSA